MHILLYFSSIMQDIVLVNNAIIAYNESNLRCAITLVYFEPTFTLNGIPPLSCGCQASTRKRIAGEGKSMVAVTHLAKARSQKAGAGILGAHMRKSSFRAAFFALIIMIHLGIK